MDFSGRAAVYPQVCWTSFVMGLPPNPPCKADARTVRVPRQCSAPSRGAFAPSPCKGEGWGGVTQTTQQLK